MWEAVKHQVVLLSATTEFHASANMQGPPCHRIQAETPRSARSGGKCNSMYQELQEVAHVKRENSVICVHVSLHDTLTKSFHERATRVSFYFTLKAEVNSRAERRQLWNQAQVWGQMGGGAAMNYWMSDQQMGPATTTTAPKKEKEGTPWWNVVSRHNFVLLMLDFFCTNTRLHILFGYMNCWFHFFKCSTVCS